MSVNSLLTQTNKGWSNLHINSLKIYDNLTVCGDSEFQGNVTFDNLNIDNLNPGPPNTFLHTNPAAEVVWEPIDTEQSITDNTTSGNVGLAYDDGTNNITVTNTPTVQTLNATSSILTDTLNASDIVASNSLSGPLDPDNINPGTDGQILSTVAGVTTWIDNTGSTNIYNSDGVLTSARILDGNGNIFRMINMGNTTIPGANLFLNTTPTANNTNTTVLVRNNATGLVQQRSVSTLPNDNIYNTDGIVNSDRVIDFDNHNSFIIGLNAIQVQSSIFDIQSDLNVANNFRLQTPPTVSASNTSILTRNTSTGNVETRNLSTFPDTSIYNTDGTLTGNRIVDCDSNNIFFSNARFFRTSGNLFMDLPSINNTETNILVRNNTTGQIQRRAASTLVSNAILASQFRASVLQTGITNESVEFTLTDYNSASITKTSNTLFTIPNGDVYKIEAKIVGSLSTGSADITIKIVDNTNLLTLDVSSVSLDSTIENALFTLYGQCIYNNTTGSNAQIRVNIECSSSTVILNSVNNYCVLLFTKLA